MADAVVLLHRLEDGTEHFDWMIEDASVDGDRRLRTWRTAVCPDQPGCFKGERIGDHRVGYLRFEGDIGGGRGCVRRVRSGVAQGLVLDERCLVVVIRWADGAAVRYVGTAPPGNVGAWDFEARVE